MTNIQKSKPSRFLYFFGDGQADGAEALRHRIGGKGASLAEMTKAGLNVPPGFTISAECCELYFQAGKQWPAGLEDEVRAHLARLEQLAGRPFGRGDNPLLVAVRSGAAQSMPGMMDTVLNVGLNPDCVRAMGQRTGNPRAAWEGYRHFLTMFGHTVGGAADSILAELLRETGKPAEADLDASEMETLCDRYRVAYAQHAGRALPTDPWEMLRQAIDAVFGSWHSERAVTFRRHHKIDGLLGTAVNVQMMCPSEVSGVMFTANPVNPALEQIIIESSYGLGEAVVLGKVMPDRFVLDRRSLAITERTIADKQHIVATLAADGRGQTGARDAASLDDMQVAELARLGLRVEGYFKVPCDIEWGLSQGRFYLLQSRAIKRKAVLDATEREQVRQEEIARLKSLAHPGGTVWARYNLPEVLPEPTPMTWAIVRRFMSGQGGFGMMYRDLGFRPDPALDDDGIFDLVCGRPYCNLSREPRLQFQLPPLKYNFGILKAEPARAVYPQPHSLTLDGDRVTWRFWLGLPILIPKIFFHAARCQQRIAEQSRTFADRFRQQVVPAFLADVQRQQEQDLTQLDAASLLERLEHWRRRALIDFARDSLKPTALAAVAMSNLERGLVKALGPERTKAALGELVMGVRPDPETDLAGGVADLAAGRLDSAAFMQRFGHRGSHEMELAQPRWNEDPESIKRLLTGGRHQAVKVHSDSSASPDRNATWEWVVAEAKLNGLVRGKLEGELQNLHTFLGLRETAKHHLMKAYAQIRRLLLELDRRCQLDGGIFYLTPDELPQLVRGNDLSTEIAQRRKRRALALSLEVPQVLFSDDLDAIGRPMTEIGGDTLQGVPLSAGVAEGPALVLHEPGGVTPPAEPYILVCPSTDPAWVPLFVGARGLVMETGGVLSHGAIVAREFGLPAVAGLPEIHRRLKTGQRLRVDGGTGKVAILP